MKRRLNWRTFFLIVCALLHVLCMGVSAAAAQAHELSLSAPPANPMPLEADASSSHALDRWSFQIGVAGITGNTLDELFIGRWDRPRGPAEGVIYLVAASYTLHEFDWQLGRHSVRPQLQVPAVLGIVDERGRSPFFQYNVGLSLRWRDFPWNRYVYTNLETGVGVTYSEHVLGIQRQRHAERDRSHLEFYWPIEVTLAHPGHRQHQLVLFIHHHSGGRIFHRGGANSVGIGYRFVFGER